MRVKDVFKSYVGNGVVYRCSSCRSDLALHDELMSKAFQGKHGRGYLFQNVINIRCGPNEDRMLTTGLHTVCDVSCAECDGSLGWKYVRAHEPTQKYKEGKYILEKQFIDKQII